LDVGGEAALNGEGTLDLLTEVVGVDGLGGLGAGTSAVRSAEMTASAEVARRFSSAMAAAWAASVVEARWIS
jgi:hypothetical protein